jgi:hypothetical protein
LVGGFLFLIPGLLIVSLALRSRLILDGERIELRSALRTHTAHRNDIEGLRKIEDQYGRRTRICLKEGRGAFNVSDSFTGNDDLKEWLNGLPNLDEQDATQITQQISNQAALEATDDKGPNALEKAKTWMICLSIAAGFVSIFALVDYGPLHAPSTVLLALFPPLGIWLVHRFPLLFTMFKRKVDPRADIGFVIIWPGIAMVMSYNTGSDHTHLVSPSPLIYWVLLILLCYVALLFRTAWENPSRWGVLAGLVLLGGIYSIGLVNAADTLPDLSVPRPYRTEILKMYVSQGRNASFRLRLAPWGPIDYKDDVSVPRHIYQQVKVGDQICIGLHPGFLRAPWYTLTTCADQSAASASHVQ